MCRSSKCTRLMLWTEAHAEGHRCPPNPQVCASKKWAAVGRKFNPPPTMTDLSHQVKKNYEKAMLAFERVRGAMMREQTYFLNGIAQRLTIGIAEYSRQCTIGAASTWHFLQ